MTLQERAQAFLDRPIPTELSKKYIPGSLSEMLIGACAAGDALNAEGAELLSICVVESDAAAERYKTPDAKAYFRECANILNAMEAE